MKLQGIFQVSDGAQSTAPDGSNIATYEMHEIKPVGGKGGSFILGGERLVGVIETDEFIALSFKNCQFTK
ncbi:hypothetical protein GFL54_19925 [Rhizobium laguerreae]|uniref:hypothetical protein n=1 Tax=Rhizobium laguerreae TaxID=1076926 RepID=UPI00143F4AC5|nr:hypothetical protein [Rhizobium laguerreae]NKM86522.1 hypothetical protein [Rhizobium laguerreae]